MAAQLQLDSLEIDSNDTFSQNEYTDVLTLKNLHSSAVSGGRNWSQLNPAEVTSMTTLATAGTGIPNAQARQVLNQFYGDQYLLLPLLGSNSNLRGYDHDHSRPEEISLSKTLVDEVQNMSLTISPNPARGQVRFAFSWLESTRQYADLMVMDVQGRTVHEQRIFSGQVDFSWQPRSLTGIFYVYLRAPGLIKAPQKLIILD
jgi:hypothetical protein